MTLPLKEDREIVNLNIEKSPILLPKSWYMDLFESWKFLKYLLHLQREKHLWNPLALLGQVSPNWKSLNTFDELVEKMKIEVTIEAKLFVLSYFWNPEESALLFI